MTIKDLERLAKEGKLVKKEVLRGFNTDKQPIAIPTVYRMYKDVFIDEKHKDLIIRNEFEGKLAIYNFFYLNDEGVHPIVKKEAKGGKGKNGNK